MFIEKPDDLVLIFCCGNVVYCDLYARCVPIHFAMSFSGRSFIIRTCDSVTITSQQLWDVRRCKIWFLQFALKKVSLRVRVGVSLANYIHCFLHVVFFTLSIPQVSLLLFTADDDKLAIRSTRGSSSTLNQRTQCHGAVKADDQVTNGNIKSFLQHTGGDEQFDFPRAELLQYFFLFSSPLHTVTSLTVSHKVVGVQIICHGRDLLELLTHPVCGTAHFNKDNSSGCFILLNMRDEILNLSYQVLESS